VRSLDPAGFYNAAGRGPVSESDLAPAVWIVPAVLLLRRPAPVPAASGAEGK